jgi:hypothetical protein
MNFNILTVVLVGVGGILVYAGIKDVNPRQVIKDALSGKENPGSNLATEGYDTSKFKPEPGSGTARL